MCESQVRYFKEIGGECAMSLSAAAVKAFKSIGKPKKSLQGSLFWEYKGKTLNDLRNEIDNQKVEKYE